VKVGGQLFAAACLAIEMVGVRLAAGLVLPLAQAFGIETTLNAQGFETVMLHIPLPGTILGFSAISIDTIYWIEGKYIPEVMKEINYFMRDWRTGTTKKMDGRTIDIMAASHRLLDVNEPYMLLSGYRSPQTNAMLRSRSGGVARNSLHLMGQAADLRLKSRSVNQMARAAQACASGGVGRYSRSNFVHMDCGTVRTWGG
jgi:uncharacterized protein YcbK (DUF882 family)